MWRTGTSVCHAVSLCRYGWTDQGATSSGHSWRLEPGTRHESLFATLPHVFDVAFARLLFYFWQSCSHRGRYGLYYRHHNHLSHTVRGIFHTTPNNTTFRHCVMPWLGTRSKLLGVKTINVWIYLFPLCHCSITQENEITKLKFCKHWKACMPCHLALTVWVWMYNSFDT